MDYKKRYFIISIHFSFGYDFKMREEPDGTFIDLATSEKYRKRLMYDCGWGQEEGYELLPPLQFSDLIALVECYAPLSKKRFWQKYREGEIEESKICGNNFLGAVSVIMQDHVEEFIDFLSEKINTDYFYNSTIRENFKWFSFSSQKSWEEGKIPGGVLTQSYEGIFNEYPKWKEIASKVKELVYK